MRGFDLPSGLSFGLSFGLHGPASYATLIVDPAGADNAVLYKARTAGEDGELVSVEYAAPATQATTTVAVSTNAITVTPGTKARMEVTGTLTAGNGTTPVVFPELFYYGVTNSKPEYRNEDYYIGNDYRCYWDGSSWILDAGTPTGASWSSAETEATPDLVMSWTPGLATGTPTVTAGISSAAQVIAAVNADVSASALVRAKEYGASTGPVAAAKGAYLALPTTLIPTIFIDSVNGNDANDGLSLYTAKQTLSAARTLATSGDVIGFVRGSTWREMFSIRAAGTGGPTFISTFMPYGTGEVPEISGADVIAGGSFTLSGHADAGGVCYEYAWTRGAGYEDGTDQPMLWENDVRLYRRTSVALCAANPGSYYCVSEEAASSTIYVHPFGSTNPISDGKTYEVTKRGAGIEAYASGCAGTKVTGPLHLKRTWGHTGTISGPWYDANGFVKQLLLGGGGLHHLVTSVPLCEDLVLYDIAKNYGTGFYPYTAYYANAIGLTHTAKRIISHGDSGADTTSKGYNLGFYSHGLTNGYDTVTYEQCFQSHSARGFSCTNPEIRALGCYTNSVNNAILTTDNSTITVKHLIARGVTASGSAGVNDSGGTNTTSKTRLIENCVIELTSANAMGFSCLLRNGTLTIRNCVVIGDFSRALECSVATGLTIVVERCIFVRTATGNVLYYPRIGTGSYTGTNNVFWTLTAASEAGVGFFNNGGSNVNFAAWKALGASYDNNSLALGTYNGYDALTDLFVEDPRTNGNYTLRTDTGLTFGDGAAITTAGPQEHWNWNTRAVASGPPTRYPTIPTTLADMKTYVTDPEAWDFYP